MSAKLRWILSMEDSLQNDADLKALLERKLNPMGM